MIESVIRMQPINIKVTSTGRPLGAERFIKRLEKMLELSRVPPSNFNYQICEIKY